MQLDWLARWHTTAKLSHNCQALTQADHIMVLSKLHIIRGWKVHIDTDMYQHTRLTCDACAGLIWERVSMAADVMGLEASKKVMQDGRAEPGQSSCIMLDAFDVGNHIGKETKKEVRQAQNFDISKVRLVA